MMLQEEFDGGGGLKEVEKKSFEAAGAKLLSGKFSALGYRSGAKSP